MGNDQSTLDTQDTRRGMDDSGGPTGFAVIDDVEIVTLFDPDSDDE